MLPINIIEELVKPLTLALRLFGNIFSGMIMVSLIALFPAGHPVGAGRPLEAVRRVHRADPGVHLRRC